jgi:hypothetical protein
MSSTASSSAEAISVFAADELYYNITPNYAICIFTLMASQLFGFGIAGLMRAFCVFPTYIVYPNLVPTVNLFDALHRDKNVQNQKKRLRFFWIVFGAIFFVRFLLFSPSCSAVADPFLSSLFPLAVAMDPRVHRPYSYWYQHLLPRSSRLGLGHPHLRRFER